MLNLPAVDPLDSALIRLNELMDADSTDAVEDEIAALQKPLIDAGLVREWGHSPTGCFWALTEAGVERSKALGAL